MDDDKAKKLAAELRASSDSSEFDLAGYGAEQCDKLAAAAFTKPLPLDKMVRFSFLVGGGKKVRQKYNDGLPALWADALKKVGFVEDRGASLALECAGLFKFQHNTDTDLKVTHVYPRVDPAAAAAAAAAAAGEPSEAALSPAELIVLSEMGTFQRMIQAKCLSLGQKRRCRTQAYTHAWMHGHMHAHTRTYTRTYVGVLLPAYMHTCTCQGARRAQGGACEYLT